MSAGKSFGLLACGALQPCGPHHFAASADFHTPVSGYMDGTRVLPSHVAVVLHYESCSFARWRLKFCEYARRQASKDAQAPDFHFYQSSMAACLKVNDAMDADAGSPGSLALRARIEYQLNAARRHWVDWKVEPPALREARGRGHDGIVQQDVLHAVVLHDNGWTLLPPLFDSTTGAVRLPPGQSEVTSPFASGPDCGYEHRQHEHDELPRTAQPARAQQAPTTVPRAAHEGWKHLIARAQLPPELLEPLLAAVRDLAGATLTPESATRAQLDTLARHAALPIGHRLRLRACGAD